MKVLTVRQPWAWLIVNSEKSVENRSWRTHYRGPLLIQASARPDPQIAAIRADVRARFGIEIPENLSLGGIVGMTTLTNCTQADSGPWHEPGNFAWILADRRALPFASCTGRLGLFDAPAVVLECLAGFL